jgi:acetolactate synthase-1/2/3 large subunit
MTGAAAFLDVLRGFGVEYLFASSGSEWPPLWEELARQKAEGGRGPLYLHVRHETLAVSMASGYTKLTGKLPVVLLHTTVGALNGAMALRAALHEDLPMLVCVGESIAFGETPGFDPGMQWLRWLADIGGAARLVEPVVKRSFGVAARSILASTVHRACQLAMTPPRGPVFVSVPFEFLVEEAPELPCSRGTFPAAPRADGKAVEDAARVLIDSRSPLVITETVGREPGAVATLVRLAERLGAPVVEALGQPYVSFPRSHGLHAGFDARPHLHEADVVLLAGAVAPWHPASRGPSSAATVIAVDDDPLRGNSPYWGYRTDVCLVGDLGAALSAILDHVERALPAGVPEIRARAARWHRLNEARRQEWQEHARSRSDARPIDPAWLFHELNAVLPEDAIVIEEAITHRLPLMRQLQRARPGACFSGQSGGLGVGAGLALGFKCAAPERPVVLVVGDGTFTYSPALAALGFAQEYRRPVLTLVCNNGGYASMKRAFPTLYPTGWAVRTDTYFGVAITPSPDYATVARAFDARGERVLDPADIRPALRRALDDVRGGDSALLEFVLAAEASQKPLEIPT